MQPKRLSKNGTIGIICTSHVADAEKMALCAAAIERLGFKVKLGANIYKDTYGYAASAKERAADLNDMVKDGSVQMILFGGGEGAVEVLPHIDYESIRRHPKIFTSYSDGTSILNAIFAQTGLITYNGITPNKFTDLRYYDYRQFCMHFVEGHTAKTFVSDSKWRTIHNGVCEGTLLGGYALLFGLMLSNSYFKYDTSKRYILFLEDHEHFSQVGAVSTFLAFIEQNHFMRNVSGLLFGHYSENVPDDLLRSLARFGERNNIPVVYTDDFGHGTRHAILPIGMNAVLDAGKQTLEFKGGPPCQNLV